MGAVRGADCPPPSCPSVRLYPPAPGVCVNTHRHCQLKVAAIAIMSHTRVKYRLSQQARCQQQSIRPFYCFNTQVLQQETNHNAAETFPPTVSDPFTRSSSPLKTYIGSLMIYIAVMGSAVWEVDFCVCVWLSRETVSKPGPSPPLVQLQHQCGNGFMFFLMKTGNLLGFYRHLREIGADLRRQLWLKLVVVIYSLVSSA